MHHNWPKTNKQRTPCFK